MSRQALHNVTSLVAANGRRIIVVLMVVAVGALLAVPATAGAHVAKKHKAQYKACLAGYGKSMMLQKDAFDRTQVEVDSAADQIGPLLGSEDPTDKADLSGLQLKEAQSAVSWSYLWPRLKATSEGAIDAFYKKALPWFRTESDREDLRYGTNEMKKSFARLFEGGFGGLALEERTLSEAVTLSDLDEYFRQHGAATQARIQAANRFNRAIGILNDLQ